MRSAAAALLSLVSACGFVACNGNPTSPTTPNTGSGTSVDVSGAPVPSSGVTTIGFGAVVSGAAPKSYSENGYTVDIDAAGWAGVTTYGNPAPSLQFTAPAGGTVAGAVRVTGGGARFRFASVDLYSSTTPIPYAITGLRGGATLVALSGTLPNTFGRFRTVANHYPTLEIDALSIVLTNAAAPCCPNPMGLDTIVLVR